MSALGTSGTLILSSVTLRHNEVGLQLHRNEPDFSETGTPQGATAALITQSTIEENNIGISLHKTRTVDIQNSRIQRNQHYGLVANEADMKLTDSAVVENYVGLFISGGQANLVVNLIKENKTGVFIVGTVTSSPGKFTLLGNSIAHNREEGILLFTPRPLPVDNQTPVLPEVQVQENVVWANRYGLAIPFLDPEQMDIAAMQCIGNVVRENLEADYVTWDLEGFGLPWQPSDVVKAWCEGTP